MGAAALCGLVSISPSAAVVLQLTRDYLRTARRPGPGWGNPASRRTRVSTRIRNHETGMLKVNGAEGSPVEIAAAVFWRVGATAPALETVDDYPEFVRVPAKLWGRQVASGCLCDAQGCDEPSLRGNPTEINQEVTPEISSRVTGAGVTPLEATLTRLAYAPETAQAGLRVPEAKAVVAALHRAFEVAVGMVALAPDRLSRDDAVELDEERTAAVVSNLLVGHRSDRDPQPAVNSGFLY